MDTERSPNESLSHEPEEPDHVSVSALDASSYGIPTPTEVTDDRECTRADVKNIYMRVSPYWRHIARKLDLPDYKVVGIETGTGGSDHDKCYDMLTSWIDFGQKEVQKPTMFRLFDAVMESGCPMDAIKTLPTLMPLIEQWQSIR